MVAAAGPSCLQLPLEHTRPAPRRGRCSSALALRAARPPCPARDQGPAPQRRLRLRSLRLRDVWVAQPGLQERHVFPCGILTMFTCVWASWDLAPCPSDAASGSPNSRGMSAAAGAPPRPPETRTLVSWGSVASKTGQEENLAARHQHGTDSGEVPREPPRPPARDLLVALICTALRVCRASSGRGNASSGARMVSPRREEGGGSGGREVGGGP